MLFPPLLYPKGGKGSAVEHLRLFCSQDTSSRAPTGSPRTSNRSAAANVANAMPQSGKRSHLFAAVTTLDPPLSTQRLGTLQVRQARACWPISSTVY